MGSAHSGWLQFLKETSLEITLAEMEDSNGLSRRGRRAFNTALSPGEWSLSTYVRPFKSAGSGSGKADDAAQVHAVEEVLWGMFLGARKWNSSGFVFTKDGDDVTSATGADNTVSGETYMIKGLGSTAVDFENMGADSNPAVNETFERNSTAIGSGKGGTTAATLVQVSNNPTTTEAKFNADLSNRSSLGTGNIYFVLGDQNRSVYKLKDCVVNEASIDFDIDGIATINWSGQCSEVNDFTGSTIEASSTDVVKAVTVDGAVSSSATTITFDDASNLAVGDILLGGDIPAAGIKIGSISSNTITIADSGTAGVAIADDASLTAHTPTQDGTPVAVGDVFLESDDNYRLRVFTGVGGTETLTTSIHEDVTETDNFIRNRLSQLDVSLDSSQRDPDSDSTDEFKSSYSLTLTGGNLSFSNNVTYITPEELGVVNTPFAHVTGTRTIGGSFTCYLTLDTDASNLDGSQSRDLFDDLRNASNVVTNSFDLTFKIGGGSGNRLEVNVPTAHIEIPQHSIEDVISMETNFMALPSTVSKTDEMTLTYKV